MDFLKKLTTIHWIFISGFVVLYIVFFSKTIASAIKLRSPFRYIFIKFALRLTYFVLIVSSILAPTFGGDEKQVKLDIKDVVFALDISLSMNCKDLKMSRIDAAKKEIKKIAEAIPNNRVCLILFDAGAYTYCPLTEDYTTFNTFLTSVKIDDKTAGFTDFASVFKEVHKVFEHKDDRTKVLVLVSDGEHFGEDISSEIASLKKENITVLSFGVGSRNETKIPYMNDFKKDESGNLAMSKLSDEVLKRISENTNGAYYEYSESENQTKQLISNIDEVQGTNILLQQQKAKSNKYIYFLFIALVLILIDLMTNVKVLKM